MQKIATAQMQQSPHDANLFHEVGVISLRAAPPGKACAGSTGR